MVVPDLARSPSDPPGSATELHLWPYRSLPARGFVWFFGGTAAFIVLPVLALLGSPVVWGLLPFILAVLAALWWALRQSYRDGAVLEVLRLSDTRVDLSRHDPRRPSRHWQANPHWVRVHLHERGGPVPNYLTLQGGPREVEIGAFLSEPERLTLHRELDRALMLRH